MEGIRQETFGDEIEMGQAEEKKKYAQCAEMRNGIAARKARQNMTESEKADLAVVEQRYRDRCY
jgi:hypothetical protein